MPRLPGNIHIGNSRTGLPRLGRKTFIQGFVKEVEIRGDDAKLTYTLPILPKGIVEETESVLGIVNHGGRYKTRTCDPLRVKQVL